MPDTNQDIALMKQSLDAILGGQKEAAIDAKEFRERIESKLDTVSENQDALMLTIYGNPKDKGDIGVVGMARSAYDFKGRIMSILKWMGITTAIGGTGTAASVAHDALSKISQ